MNPYYLQFLKQSCEKYQDVNFCYDKYYEYDFIIMNLIEYGIDFGIFIDDNGNSAVTYLIIIKN